MTRHKVMACCIALGACTTSLFAASTPAPAPSFTISASNVTMPSSGTVPIPFTLTSVNGFVGQVAVACGPPTEPVGVKAPFCYPGGPVMAYTLAANGTATGILNILAMKPNVVPAVTRSSLQHHGQQGGWALAAVIVLGFGLRRKRSQHLTRIALGAGILLAAAALNGCGGPPTLTPGAYVFTLNANSVAIVPALTASTTATVTVPAGIETN